MNLAVADISGSESDKRTAARPAEREFNRERKGVCFTVVNGD